MERLLRGGVARLSSVVEHELRGRNCGLQVLHIKGLADLAASVLHCRSVNTSEIAAVLPRALKNDDSRYRVINRWLQNPKIDPVRVMAGFVPELIEEACSGGRTAVLMIEQWKPQDNTEERAFRKANDPATGEIERQSIFNIINKRREKKEKK